MTRPDSVTFLHRTPTSEWWLVRCGSKNGHRNAITSLQEIGLRAQNLLTILGSAVKMVVGGGRPT